MHRFMITFVFFIFFDIRKNTIFRVFNRQLSQKYLSLDQISPLSDIFEQKSCMARPNKRTQKTDGINF